MSENAMENNQVIMAGTILSGFTFSHEIFGEGFYIMDISVARLSGQEDVIPLMISDRLINIKEDYRGLRICVQGQFRSYNRHDSSKNRLVLSVFVREFYFPENEADESESNQIFLDGFICREPVYRKTPLGREIADLLLAVNRSYGKSDYIPCIVWGRNARYLLSLQTGERVRVWGRVQSRVYNKKLSEENSVQKTAYEISVSKLECVPGAF